MKGIITVFVLAFAYTVAFSRQAEQEKTPLQKLIIAGQEGNLDEVKKVLASNPEIINGEPGRSTPLHVACFFGQKEVAEYLISKGANVNATDESNYTPLHSATSSKQTAIIQLLLNHRANVAVKTKTGNTPLHNSMFSGAVEDTKILLDKGANPYDMADDGQTGVTWAMKVSDLTSFAGIVRDFKWYKNAIWERYNGRAAVVELALRKRPRPDIFEYAFTGNEAKVKELLSFGINTNVTSGGETILHKAAACGHLPIVDLLIKQQVNVNIQSTESQATALHCAVTFNRKEIIHKLLESNADPNIKQMQGFTALHLAAIFSDLPVVKELLEKSAVADAKSNRGLTALDYATNSGNIEVAEFLKTYAAPSVKKEDNQPEAAPKKYFSGDPSPFLEKLSPADGFDFAIGKPDAKGYSITQPFGGPEDHLGEDWGGNIGDPVYAIADGIVFYADHYMADQKGWGNVIRVVHNAGTKAKPEYVESLYAHLDEIQVKAGDVVKRGQQIGTVGTAFGATNPHLHLAFRRKIGLPIGPGYSKERYDYESPINFINAHRPKRRK